jgi:hypothetical protein
VPFWTPISWKKSDGRSDDVMVTFAERKVSGEVDRKRYDNIILIFPVKMNEDAEGKKSQTDSPPSLELLFLPA